MELSLEPRTLMTHELGLDAKARFGVGAVIPRVDGFRCTTRLGLE